MAPPKAKRYFDSSSENTKKTKHNKIHKNKFNEKNDDSFVNITTDLSKKGYVNKKFQKKNSSKYPGRAPVPPELIEKHSRGEGLNPNFVIKQDRLLKQIQRKEKLHEFANEQAARTELLLTEDSGFLEADDGETTTQFTQKEIARSVDIAAAAKHFDLQLQQFGPYRMKYSRNGRHLLLGGKMGHIAAFDWVTKRLHCEINVMESVHDVCWSHIETMFTVAQKDWVYMYDNKGVELHCVKKLNKVLRMEFLPYHFLLATGSELGYLSWLDISIGEIVAQYRTNIGRISVMKQNPRNAVICVGESKGIVSMWAPTVRKSLASILCHKAPVSGLAIDPKGIYMATSSVDRSVKIWDIRKLEGPLQKYILNSPASQIEFSHKNMLALGMGNVVEIYRDCCQEQAKKPYLRHKMNYFVENMSFCPYEDVLGVTTNKSFTSVIVPGSGEANFDALEANPYQAKTQRREAEVKALLEKIQPELITLDPSAIADVHVPSLREKMEAREKLLLTKPQMIDYTPRKKTKNKGTAKVSRNKKIVKEMATKEHAKMIREFKSNDEQSKPKQKEKQESFGVLDRFLPKKK